MWPPMRAFVVTLLLIACGSSQATHPSGQAPTGDAEFARATDAFIAAHLAFRPTFAVDLGLHEYDGKVPDRSPPTIAAEVERLRAARATFIAFDETKLSAQR